MVPPSPGVAKGEKTDSDRKSKKNEQNEKTGPTRSELQKKPAPTTKKKSTAGLPKKGSKSNSAKTASNNNKYLKEDSMGWGKRGRHRSDENKQNLNGSDSKALETVQADSNNVGEEDGKAYFAKRPRDISPSHETVSDVTRLMITDEVGAGDSNSGATTAIAVQQETPQAEASSSPVEGEEGFEIGDIKIRTSVPKPLKVGSPKMRRGPRVPAARSRTAYPKKMSPSKCRKPPSSAGSTSSSSDTCSGNSESTVTPSEEEVYITIDCEEVAHGEALMEAEDSEEDMSITTSGSVDIIPPDAEDVAPEIVPAIRPSYFPYVPPYINFCMHNQKCEPLPKEIQKHLKWRWSNITPVVVKKTLTNSGFRVLRKTVEWGGHWGRHMKAALFKTSLKDFQKLNHLPGTFQIGRKDRLWRNIQKYMAKFGDDDFAFMPKTFVLPIDLKQLKAAWDSSEMKGHLWIVKPPAGARGSGIRVVNRWNQVPKKKPVIVQSYIGNPYLINDRKFDLRLYVLVTNFHPLKVYLYNDGLVRFAPVKYSSDSKRAGDRFMHLTNYSINKNCELYTQNEDAEASEGHKWTLKTLWRHFINEGKDVEKLWTEIEEIVIKTLICAEDPIVTATTCYLPNLYNGYELFGFDIILDSVLKPWLLEVNISPSLHSSSPLDLAVKGPMIKEVLNIAGYQLPPKLSPILKTMFSNSLDIPLELETPVFDKRIYVNNSLSKEEQGKHKFYKNKFGKRDEYLTEIIHDLTPDDVRQLIVAEDELSQCDNFCRIFPTASTFSYTRYFENPRYYNMLFDAWETMYHEDRPQAVARLRGLCRKKVHLQVPINAGSMISESQVSETECTEITNGLEAIAELQSTPIGDKKTEDFTIPSKTEQDIVVSMDEMSEGVTVEETNGASEVLSIGVTTTTEVSLASPSPATINSSTPLLSQIPTPSSPPTPAVLDNITNISSTCPCHVSPGSDRNTTKTPASSKVSDLPKGVCC